VTAAQTRPDAPLAVIIGEWLPASGVSDRQVPMIAGEQAR